MGSPAGPTALDANGNPMKPGECFPTAGYRWERWAKSEWNAAHLCTACLSKAWEVGNAEVITWLAQIGRAHV